jgi:hypothetical protein
MDSWSARLSGRENAKTVLFCSHANVWRVHRPLLNALSHDDLSGRLEALAGENPVAHDASAFRTGSGKCPKRLQVHRSIPRTDALSNSIQQFANCCFKLAFEHEQKSVKSRDESSEARTPTRGYRSNTREVAGGRWPGFRRSGLSGHDYSPNLCTSGSECRCRQLSLRR